MDWGALDAALFDLDGVITSTSLLHRRAWAATFTRLFESLPDQPAWTDADYFAHVDGLPRMAGVRGALQARGVDLPEGTPDDPPDARTVHGLARQKNAEVERLIARDGVEAYPGTIALLDSLTPLGVRLAVVSSSRNARRVLEAAGVLDRFELVLDGRLAEEGGLAGKPAPDTFLHAAELLGVEPRRTAVVEDAVSGVAAGRAGGFGMVLGVDRGTGERALLDAGADLVVRDLAEVVA